jgi:hypothetical protein
VRVASSTFVRGVVLSLGYSVFIRVVSHKELLPEFVQFAFQGYTPPLTRAHGAGDLNSDRVNGQEFLRSP